MVFTMRYFKISYKLQGKEGNSVKGKSAVTGKSTIREDILPYGRFTGENKTFLPKWKIKRGIDTSKGSRKY